MVGAMIKAITFDFWDTLFVSLGKDGGPHHADIRAGILRDFLTGRGEEFTLDTDLVIVAIGSGANPLLTRQTKGLDLNKWGYVVTNEAGRTSREGVWAGGDIVTGSATVILAMGAGKTAAKDIHEYLCPPAE